MYVLNLSSDEERLNSIKSQAASYEFMSLQRVEAIHGSHLPHSVCVPLTGNKWSVNHKGTLACFLGHVSAWEQMAAIECPFSVFVEDDIVFQNLNILESLSLPEDVDIIFANDRMCYKSLDGEVEFLPILPALSHIEMHGQSVGGDGYILTQRGAKKLLSFIETDGFFSHVDLRLLSYCLNIDVNTGNDPGLTGVIRNIYDLRNSYPRSHFLEGRVLSPSLCRHLGGANSRRAAADKPIIFD